MINYVTAYVSKCSKAVVVKGKDVYVHKGYAWLAFMGGRMFSVTREYRREKTRISEEVQDSEKWNYQGVAVI